MYSERARGPCEYGTSGDLRLVNREVRQSRRQICASNSRKMYASEPSDSH